jgi:hypothetical protein
MRAGELSKVMSAMATAGCTPEQMASVSCDLESTAIKEADVRRKAATDRKRKQRKMSKDVCLTSSDVTHVTRDSEYALSPLAPLDKESTPTPPKEINPPISPHSQKTRGAIGLGKLTAVEELVRVLDSEHAIALIDHLNSLKRPLTSYRANYLAKEFERTPDPNAAAELMIGRGWQGFESAWITRRFEPRISRSPPAARNESRQRHDDAIAECNEAMGRLENDRKGVNHAAHVDLGPRDFHRHREAKTEGDGGLAGMFGFDAVGRHDLVALNSYENDA